MKGGRLRGQGTYGCVFQPALLCKGIHPGDKKVGKITAPIDAKNELEIAKYLSTIPAAVKYTIVAETQSCEPLDRNKQVDPDMKACLFSKGEDLQNMVQLIMPFGGIPLDRVNLNPRTFDIFRFAEELLEIGAFLVLHDVCHMDIWGQNFLFNRETKPKLIDFGFAFRPTKLKQTDLKSRWRVVATDHDTETPEVTLMLGKFKNIPSSELIFDMERQKPVVQRLAVFCDVLPSEWSAQLKKWSEESKSFQQKDWLSCWKLYWPGFDAWGFGALLLSVLEIQMSSPEFTRSAAWMARGTTMKTVLRGLCNGNPVHRLDAVEALNVLTNGSHPLFVSGGSGASWVDEKQRRRPRA